MSKMLTVSYRDGVHQDAVENPVPRHSVLTSAAATVSVTVEDDGCITIGQIDVTVECGLVVSRDDGHTLMRMRTEHFTIIPA